MWVTLDIVTHARVVLVLFDVTYTPFKLWHDYGMIVIIGTFLTKLHNIIDQALLCRLRPSKQ